MISKQAHSAAEIIADRLHLLMTALSILVFLTLTPWCENLLICLWQEPWLISPFTSVQLRRWHSQFADNLQLLWRCVGGRRSIFHSFARTCRHERTDGCRRRVFRLLAWRREWVREEYWIWFKFRLNKHSREFKASIFSGSLRQAS